ncbi:HD-GYP domain-containing protein, partial [Desulfobulbus sp. N3]|nr:HD-GYP domain-containing protein [Desulfobulbus sp. N3]
LGELAEHRDANTGGHINRTRFFVKTLAETLFDKKKFPDILTQEYIVLLYKTAPLHDIGKVAIRDSILLKKGRLTAEEFAEMKKHTIYGEEVIDKLAKMAGEPMAFLECARDMVGSHHEKHDGTGYPRGLAGDNIPLAGRIMAVADVYDALRTRRSYKKAFSHEETMYIMDTEDGRGRRFDPDVYDALLCIEHEFARIAEENSKGIK